MLGRVRDLIMKRFMGGYRPKACAQALGPEDCTQLACNVTYIAHLRRAKLRCGRTRRLFHAPHLLPCACALHACSASREYDADASVDLIKVQDAFNKPVASAPDAYIQVLERNPPDGQK